MYAFLILSTLFSSLFINLSLQYTNCLTEFSENGQHVYAPVEKQCSYYDCCAAGTFYEENAGREIKIRDCSSDLTATLEEYFHQRININCKSNQIVTATTSYLQYIYRPCLNDRCEIPTLSSYNNYGNRSGVINPSNSYVQCEQTVSLIHNGNTVQSNEPTGIYTCNSGDICIAGEFYYRRNDNDNSLLTMKGCSSNVQAFVKQSLGQMIALTCDSNTQQLKGDFRYAYNCCQNYQNQKCLAPNVDLTHNNSHKLTLITPLIIVFILYFVI